MKLFKHILLSIMLTLGWLSQAVAADLGGNCCADLEERVAELEATTARKGNRKVSLTVYGHVHEAILFHDIDDIETPKVSMIPGTQSVSRFGFRGTSKLTTEWEAGFVIEVGVGGFEPGRNGPERNLDLQVRKSSLFVRSKVVGTVFLGRDSMATDGITEIDLSQSGIASTALSLAPYDQALLGFSVDPFDGYRADAARWVSPTIAGFQVSAAFSDEDTWDAALRYAGEFGSVRIAGGVGYRVDDGPLNLDLPDTKTIAGSGSITEINSGLFLSGAYGDINLSEGNPHVKGWSLRAGIERPIAAGVKGTGFGEYGKVEFAGEDLEMFGGGLVVSTGAVSFYGTMRHLKPDMGDDINVGVAGVKIEF